MKERGDDWEHACPARCWQTVQGDMRMMELGVDMADPYGPDARSSKNPAGWALPSPDGMRGLRRFGFGTARSPGCVSGPILPTRIGTVSKSAAPVPLANARFAGRQVAKASGPALPEVFDVPEATAARGPGVSAPTAALESGTPAGVGSGDAHIACPTCIVYSGPVPLAHLIYLFYKES
jgi:hypothetical protein